MEQRSAGPSADGGGGKYLALGVQFAASILLFLFLGRWLDRRLGTAPWLLIVGVFAGAGASFFSIYRQLMADLRRDEQARAARRGTPGSEP